MPQRAAAWALLEERLRVAAAFCDRVRERAPDPIAKQLAPVGEALTGVADSLAAHFGDWGASPAPDPEAVTPTEPISFEDDIKTLFRSRDRESMRFAFDLWSYDDVSTHADDILARVRSGTMPCDGAWPKEQVDTLQSWIDAGKPR